MSQQLKTLFSAQDVSKFYRKNNVINIICLSVLYIIIGLIIGLYPYFGNWLYIVFCFLIIGAVQHTFATFVHEAAHLNLFTDKRMNDFFGHFLCSAPLISYLNDYRYFHMEHHRHAGNFEKDPELKFYRAMGLKPAYQSRKDVLKVFINDFNGYNYAKALEYVLKFFTEKRNSGIVEKPTVIDHLCILFWLTVVPLVLWKFNLFIPFIIFWILPIFTLTPLLIRWHSYGEHIREMDVCPSENTFTHKFPLIQTLFLYPINSSYHLEHHLYPQIPWHALKDFHNWAGQNPVYKERSERLTVDGYFLGNKTILKAAFPIQK